jgi:general secretion pathway protein B
VSSILKALKKLEDEKALKQGGAVDLARDILRPAEPRRSSPLRLPLLILALILFGGLVGMVLMTWMSPDAPLAPVAQVPQVVQSLPDVQVPAVAPASGDGESALSAAPLQPSAESVQPTHVTQPAPQTPATAHAPARPQLVISGIVYQEEPESRIAIINALPTMTGTLIDGARVEEIRAGSVVFSYAGERFEVFFAE